MGTSKFLELCENILVSKFGYERNLIFMVWSCKTLQNNKALLSTAVNDGKYYEFTYNGNKNEMYVDEYVKQSNQCIKY